MALAAYLAVPVNAVSLLAYRATALAKLLRTHWNLGIEKRIPVADEPDPALGLMQSAEC